MKIQCTQRLNKSLSCPMSLPIVSAPDPCVQCYEKVTQPKIGRNATIPSKRSHPRPMQNSKQRIIHHIGIMPIPDLPPDPPRFAGPPPKLLPLLLLLIDLLFVTPAEAWPLPMLLPDAFLFFFDPPRKLPRPLLPPRLFELS